MATTSARKARGAFYTDIRVARFLVQWAVRHASDTVLDPCFGGAVFLSASLDALSRMEGDVSGTVTGVELDPEAFAEVQELLKTGPILPRLVQGDFFEIAPSLAGSFSAVVGNPPFVRYQLFSGRVRSNALSLATRLGVRVSKLCSSWAPFLVAATACLREDGRLGMVVPAEIAHAGYARPVLDFVARSFRNTTLLTFRERLFPALSQDTMLLLADGKRSSDAGGSGYGRLEWLDLDGPADLSAARFTGFPDVGGERLAPEALVSGTLRFAEQFLPTQTRGLYHELANSPGVTRLGTVARVGIGYVTGANSFFHLSRRLVERYRVPERFTRRAATRTASFKGLLYTDGDWQRGWERGEPSRLLYLTDGLADVPGGLLEYLSVGVADGVPSGFKCRTRHPWYRVPHVSVPDAILTYMSGQGPRFVANVAGVVVPNTLHMIRFHAWAPPAMAIAASFQTSLTQLSAEIEGHRMGGGLLKLEPTEAEQVVFCSEGPAGGVHFHAIDGLMRERRLDEARTLADETILVSGLGLSRRECVLLFKGATELRERRRKGSAPIGAEGRSREDRADT